MFYSYYSIMKVVKGGWSMSKRIYLFYGTESFLIENKIKNIIHKSIPEDQRDMNVITYDLLNTPIEEIIQDAETLPFLADHKIVIGKNAFLFTGQKVPQKIEHQIDRLEQYLEQPVDFSTLIFWVPVDKLDERRKIVKQMKKFAQVESFSSLSDASLLDWLTEIAKKEGVEILPEAGQLLIHLVGQDLQLLNQEIIKMATYVGKSGLIDEKVVQELSVRTIEQDIFALIDQVANLQIEVAFQIFYDLLKNKEDPIKMVALLARQFRLILYSKELQRKGYSAQQIASQLGTHPYAIQIALKQSVKFNEQQLQNILIKLAEIDYEIKTGLKDKVLALEMFFFYLKNPTFFP